MKLARHSQILFLAGAAGTLAAREPQVVFRVTAETVVVDVSVTRGSTPVTGLKASDFRVWDSGVQQRIDALSMQGIPVDVSLALETTRLAPASLQNLSARLEAIAGLLRTEDRLRVLTIGTYVSEVLPMQPAARASRIRITSPGGRAASLYDALVMSLLHEVEPTRRHLIVALTREHDLRSAVDSTSLREVVSRSDAVVHIVEIASQLDPWPDAAVEVQFRADEYGRRTLTEIAELTGGQFHGINLFRDRVVEGFGRAFDQFRQSYVLSYSPEGVPREGWHQIRVELATPGGYTVRARRGYFRASPIRSG